MSSPAQTGGGPAQIEAGAPAQSEAGARAAGRSRTSSEAQTGGSPAQIEAGAHAAGRSRMSSDLAPVREEAGSIPARGPAGAVGAVVGDALDASVQRLLVADPVARAGKDPEGVHQARVATRRLRCDLRTFGPLLDPAWAEPLREELRWLGRELGIAREAEVLLGHLRDHARSAGGAEIERHAQKLLAAALAEHEAAQLRVLTALSSSRYLDLVDRLVQGAMAPRLRPTAASATKRDLVRLARRPWKRLAREYSALSAEPPDSALHALRIRAKRARYAVEAVADAVGGKRPRRLAAALTDLQDVLGAHQDAVIAQAWLHDRVGGENPDESYAAGVLAGLLRADARAARDALAEAWHRASRPRLRTFL
jgi:CHAD domain-containing protein